MNHAVEYAGQPKQGARGRAARGPAAADSAPAGGAKGGSGKGKKRGRDAGKRTAYPRLPGGMGSAHNGGKPCTNHAHDPTKGGISENDPKKGTSVPCVIIRAVPPHAFT